MAGALHKQLLAEAYSMFALTNPMHSDVFPSVRKMEGEVVAMTASILGGEVGPLPGRLVLRRPATPRAGTGEWRARWRVWALGHAPAAVSAADWLVRPSCPACEQAAPRATPLCAAA